MGLRKNAKDEKHGFSENSSQDENSQQLEWTGAGELPAGASVDAAGVPTYMGATGNKLTWLITLAASAGFGLFGYDQGVMSGIIGAQQFFETFPAVDPSVQGSARASILSASIQLTPALFHTVGCLIGAIFALMYGDLLGRRKMMFTGVIVLCVGVLIQVTAFAGHEAGAQFVVGRTITGVGTGFLTSTIPTWHAECAKAKSRGFAVFIEAAMISTGTMVAYWVNLGFSYLPGSGSWRGPIALQCIFAFALVGLVWFLPESPRWLISKGHLVEGQRVVAALEPAPFNSEAVILQTRVILDSCAGRTHAKKKDLLTNGPTQHFRRMLIGASSQFFQQIGGCNAVIYFSTPIFQDYLGLDRQLALILGAVLATVYALSACISFPLVDRFGRRKLFLGGSIGQSVAMFLIMACLIPGTDNPAISGSVVGMFLYLTVFGCTWLELPWLYPAEINPLRTRTQANAASTITNWLFNFAVVMLTPPFLERTAIGTFAFFGAINLCFLPFIYFFYPETAGRSLEEIDIIFARGYVDNVSYVKMAKEMPSLTTSEIAGEWQRLGLGEMPDPELAAAH
ncbi:sugar porter family MFS transporter [Sporobolomyces salmoneus]|uniref:sugar porter family MFS transporter n=1 Tax=Sporobolomyces salmoneus TaxID=183962 RepID=UPI003173FCB3